jgi:hypothetical protein
VTKDDPSVTTAAPDQTVAFTSPYEAKTHTPSVRGAAALDKGEMYRQGEWSGLPLYRCPAPEDVCQFSTTDGDSAVEAHIQGAHPELWMELAMMTSPEPVELQGMEPVTEAGAEVPHG